MHNRIMSVLNNRLMIVIGLSFIIYHLSFSPVGAQTFTQQLQKTAKGEGQVRLHQDKAIDELVNGAGSTATTPKATTPATPKPAVQRPAVKDNNERKNNKLEKTEKTEPLHNEITEHSTDTTTLKKPAHTMKMVGFRVQAFAGGNSRRDRQKAEQTGNQLRALFPNEQVYTHFYSPRWICRIGNYRTYEEAHQMLQEVKKLGYTSATIVKGKISVAY